MLFLSTSSGDVMCNEWIIFRWGGGGNPLVDGGGRLEGGKWDFFFRNSGKGDLVSKSVGEITKY